MKQRALAAALHRFDDLEVLQRDRVDQQAIGRRLVGDAPDVREIGFLRVAQVVEQGAGGGHGGRVAVEAESFETAGPELIEQRASCGFVLERPRLDAGDWQPIAGAVEQDVAQVEIDGATISRGLSTITSSASACSPAWPAYSAHENSPVVTSRSADPDDGV